MTPDERLAAHAQWLLDHDRGLAEIREIQRQQADVHRQQSAVLLEVAQHLARLLDRDDGDRPPRSP